MINGKLRRICFVRTGAPADAATFERAVRLCGQTDAALSIVSVVEEPPAKLLGLLASMGAPADVIVDEREHTAAVDNLLDKARVANVDASGEVLRGTPALEIIRKVFRDGDDLLIKATQPSRVIERVLFGRVDRRLVRRCPCPVWIDKPRALAGHPRILAAVDPAPFRDEPDFDAERESLNAAILEFAILLAQSLNAELHVVHVWSFDLEGPLESRGGFTAEAVAKVGETVRRKHELALEQLVAPVMRDVSEVHLLKGAAGEEIARLATSERCDVVVMGTICRVGILGLLLGNTAETVLDEVDCSVVAIKPRGFVSPVRPREPEQQPGEP